MHKVVLKKSESGRNLIEVKTGDWRRQGFCYCMRRIIYTSDEKHRKLSFANVLHVNASRETSATMNGGPRQVIEF
jgi:hypothetical protein